MEEQNLTRIMADVLFIVYNKQPLSPGQIIKILTSKGVEFNGEILIEVLEKLKKKQLIEGSYAASPDDPSRPPIEYFLMTEKGTKFVQARIKEAEAENMTFEHIGKK